VKEPTKGSEGRKGRKTTSAAAFASASTLGREEMNEGMKE
jgi:hypothetical protein